MGSFPLKAKRIREISFELNKMAEIGNLNISGCFICAIHYLRKAADLMDKEVSDTLDSMIKEVDSL